MDLDKGDQEMYCLHNEQVPFSIKFLQKITSLASELDLRGYRRDEPDLSVETVPFIEHMVEVVYFLLDFKFIFFPPDQANIYSVITGTSSIGESFVGSLLIVRRLNVKIKARRTSCRLSANTDMSEMW